MALLLSMVTGQLHRQCLSHIVFDFLANPEVNYSISNVFVSASFTRPTTHFRWTLLGRGILTNYEYNDEMVAIKSKCFDETVLCRIDNLLSRVSNCPFQAEDQCMRHSHRYPGVFLIRFFSLRHKTRHPVKTLAEVQLNIECWNWIDAAFV